MPTRLHLSTFVAAIAAAVLALAPAGPAKATVAPQVLISTPLGDIVVQLDPDAAPNTVANFLQYINDGDYNDSFIHRNANLTNSSVNVIQGGGFTIADTGDNSTLSAEFQNILNGQGRTNFGLVSAIEANAPIANEFNQSNLRGTIAMARQGGLPDSATSQWFINVSDNVALDSIDGGFTVFGTVVSGMDVVDAIHGLNDFTIGDPSNPELFPLADTPTLDTAQGPSLERDEVVLTDISIIGAVPEPSSLALIALGGLAMIRRRR